MQLPSSFWKNPSGHLSLSDLHFGSSGWKRQSLSGLPAADVFCRDGCLGQSPKPKSKLRPKQPKAPKKKELGVSYAWV